MVGPTGITVALAMYWLTGVVGAASLPPDDQYSPQQSPYRRDVAQGPRGYPNWLKYKPDPTTILESSHNGQPPGSRRPETDDFRTERKDSVLQNLDIIPRSSGEWDISDNVMKNSTGALVSHLGVPEFSKISSASGEDRFLVEDTFQDQGPGSVEVYKLDLRRENSLLVPRGKDKQPAASITTKTKMPKKAIAEEILWKLKSLESGKASLPGMFQQPPRHHKVPESDRRSNRKIKASRKDDAFAVGGVPELQVGCEGLEASEREKRSSGAGVEDIDFVNSHKYQDPVYRESTEPILLRVTPIVLDLEEDEPPSGEIYEEMDELLKLKKQESTSPKPTTRRWNRADIDPALEIDKHQEGRSDVETLPERGDLGPSTNGTSDEIIGSIPSEDSKSNRNLRQKRNAHDDEDSSAFVRTENSNHQGGRKLLWVQLPEEHEDDNDGHQNDQNMWGFGEDDGASEDDFERDARMNKLRQAEIEKRQREYEKRRQEELERRRDHGHRSHQGHPPRKDDVNSEVEKIREEYERLLEQEQRERQTIEAQRRRQGISRGEGQEDPRRSEETRRRQDEETKRNLEEEERRNRDPSNLRRQEEEERRREWHRRRQEEEEKRRRLEDQRNRQDPPASLTRPESSRRAGNMFESQQEEEAEQRKLREYIERNRPIDPKRTGERRRPEEQSRRNQEDERRRQMGEQRRMQMEEERRRQQMEEQRRKQPDEEERRRQMEELRRKQQQEDEDKRRMQMEEQRKRDQTAEEERRRRMEESRVRDRSENPGMEEERRRRMEEERKLQEYVRRNQPVNVPRRNNSGASTTLQGNRDLEEQRRTLEAARQWERNRQPSSRGGDRRIHGPSAPTGFGQRQSQADLEEIRRRQERYEEEHRREANRRFLQEEERRREAAYRNAESRKREEERKRLEAATRRDMVNLRPQLEGQRRSWQESVPSHSPAAGQRGYHATGEARDREAGELRRHEDRTMSTDARNRESEWRRRAEERERERVEWERQRLENERKSRNNGSRLPHYETRGSNTRLRGESDRGSHDEIEWRRREHARLSSLPVKATIVLRPDDASRNRGSSRSGTTPAPSPFTPSFNSRSDFGNDIEFSGLTPNRPGLAAQRFPVPPTPSPPVKSPGACIWAIVQCCPGNNRITSCFESMGCPGVNWDPNPCRSSLTDAARAEVVKFYAAADAAKQGY